MSAPDLTRSQFISRSAKSGLALAVAGSLASLAAEPAFAATGGEFFAMFTNFGSAPRVSAHLDLAVDTRTAPGPVDVTFSAFSQTGASLAEFVVLTNANGFASSSSAQGPNKNLFRLTGGESGLVRARIPSTATFTAAVLTQRGQGSRLAIGVPAARATSGSPIGAGTNFPVAIGDVATASLLVANVSGTDLAADVFVGSIAGVGGGKYTIPRLTNMSIWRVDLQPSDVNSLLIVSATDQVVVQLIIDDGRVNGITCLPV